MKPKLPRGVRINNPGNIRKGSPWQGLTAEQPDKDFCQFKDPTWGIRALAIVLINYQDKHGIRTIRDIINRWAPPVENDTSAYVAHVAEITGIEAYQKLDLHSYAHLAPIVEAIIRHENGRGPKPGTINTWYDRATIDAGLQRAGVVRPHAVAAGIPATRETVAATGTAGLGVAQLADVAPQVMTAMESSESHLSSGSMVRIFFGVASIGLAAYIAYSQMKKHQLGVVA